MSNLENRKAAEKAILDCRKTLFECALRREQISMARDLAKVYTEDVILSESVSMNTAIRMQEAIEDRYYTEEGGIFSTIGDAIKKMFAAIKKWLFGEDAPSRKPSDYPVKEVVPDVPTDVNGIAGTMKEIEKISGDLGNIKDPSKAREIANTIKDKLASALKPTTGKMIAVSIGTLCTTVGIAVAALANAEKTAAKIEDELKDPNISEEDKKIAEEKLQILNDITSALANAEKRIMSILHKAQRGDTVKIGGALITDDMPEAQKKRVRIKWFQYKFRYACTENNLGSHSKNIPVEMFPNELRDEMKDKDGLTKSDLMSIASSLGTVIPLLPDDYKKKAIDARDSVRSDDAGGKNHLFDYIPDSWWTSGNPYRIDDKKKNNVLKACRDDGVDFDQVMDAYCKSIKYNKVGYDNAPFAPEEPTAKDEDDED